MQARGCTNAVSRVVNSCDRLQLRLQRPVRGPVSVCASTQQRGLLSFESDFMVSSFMKVLFGFRLTAILTAFGCEHSSHAVTFGSPVMTFVANAINSC